MVTWSVVKEVELPVGRASAVSMVTAGYVPREPGQTNIHTYIHMAWSNMNKHTVRVVIFKGFIVLLVE